MTCLSTVPMLVVCVANAWRGTAFSMLLLSAGLRNVPARQTRPPSLKAPRTGGGCSP